MIAVSKSVRELKVACYCGQWAHLHSNARKYGREYGNGMAWLCDNWPKCDGYIGCHPDGRPLGYLSDSETQQYRRMVHAQIDPLWKNRTDRSKKRNRGSVYGWLRRLMKMTADECHISKFTKEQCIEALEQIALHPYQIRGKG